MKWIIHRLQVNTEKTGMRLDQYLADSAIGLSRTQAKKIIDIGGVHIDGRRVRSCSKLTQVGDGVEVYIDQLSLDPYRLTKDAILFQDKFIIVLNKPALIDTQPTHARFKGTLFEALQCHLKDPFRPHQKAEIGMIQRLDRGTSGVIVFSIHPRAHKEMTRVFVEHEAKKTYLALVHGVPDSEQGEIRSFLARSRKENRVKSVDKGGKEAITRFQVVDTFEENSLLNVDILTGRSHQIRAHMAELGCPLVGDQRYGGQGRITDIEVVRPLLHAQKLAFRHPVLDQNMVFSVPVPDDMQDILTVLRKNIS
ncbi:MAG: RluA family pseudouridine synthase [Desulfuromusa sp.]|jgi:23S rRNA pseudouridine1911/1915/1917 synthase|nr:RluA family pseudouridine synthase [Desulfuromusa sp.]